MGESKEVIRNKLKSMTNEEIVKELNAHVNIEFIINKTKFIFKNVKDSFLSEFILAEFIKVLTLEIEWYNYSSFDTIIILDEAFLIIEYTKSRIVLVQEN